MIQGGDPNTKDPKAAARARTARAGPGYTIKAEFNDTPHKRGIVSMARAQSPDSAGSQFFICVKDSCFLDRQYTAFGRVVRGMEVADKIVGAPRDARDNPNERVEMKVKRASTLRPVRRERDQAARARARSRRARRSPRLGATCVRAAPLRRQPAVRRRRRLAGRRRAAAAAAPHARPGGPDLQGPARGGRRREEPPRSSSRSADGADAAQAILARLGFRAVFRYQKYRETYHWQDVEIVVDETPIGTFLEIEGRPEAIHAAAAALGRRPEDYITRLLRRALLRARAARATWCSATPREGHGARRGPGHAHAAAHACCAPSPRCRC